MSKPIRLSPSALNLFLDCKRCFWLDKVRGLKRPRGIFPSLPSGMDGVIKTYFDGYRKKNTLPPEFQVDSFSGIGLYQDQKQLDLWREWRTGPQLIDEDGAVLFGALDDLLVKDDYAIPFDYKTKGSPTTVQAAVKYYQNQLDCYGLMLEANGLKTNGYGFLLYYSPKNVSEKGWVLFNLQAIRIDIDTNRARKTFRSAIELIQQDSIPKATQCEYCEWVVKMKNDPVLMEA